jgi:hypothetical protein
MEVGHESRNAPDRYRSSSARSLFFLDDVASVLLWNNVTVYAMQKAITFTPTVKATHALVMLKDIKSAQ